MAVTPDKRINEHSRDFHAFYQDVVRLVVFIGCEKTEKIGNRNSQGLFMLPLLLTRMDD